MSTETGKRLCGVALGLLFLASLFVHANYYGLLHMSAPNTKPTTDDLWGYLTKLGIFIFVLVSIVRPFYMIPRLPSPYGLFITSCFVLVELMGIATVIAFYAEIYVLFGLKNSAGADVNDPMSCLYFSIITWTTVGYGDLLPSNTIRLVAASEALVGYVAMAFLIAFLTQRLTSWSSEFGLREDFEAPLPRVTPKE